MNVRGQYSKLDGQPRTHVGATLVHTLELKQRYDNAKTAAVQALLNDLSRDGVASSIGTNRWEIALNDGAWVHLTWYPDYAALEVTITDRELRPVDQVAPTRRRYEAILRKITPRLRTYGATTVGAVVYAGQAVTGSHLWARSRAIQAVNALSLRARAPYYVYAEVDGTAAIHAARALDEANAIYFALDRARGEVYASIFDVTDTSWPGPAADVYRAVPQRTRSPRQMVGITLYHSVGDRADAVKQMAVDWDALYQNLAVQAGELTPDPKVPSGYRTATQLEWDANPPDPNKGTWWKSYAKPLIKQWAKFKSEQLGTDTGAYLAFAERFQTNWDVYEQWKAKLDTLRAEALKHGFTIDAPVPTDLPTTLWADVANVVKRGAEKVAAGGEDVWKFAKYAAYGVLGIGAVVALSSVAQNLRSGKDPSEKYMELIRERRRPRALPEARTQRALPPGEDT